MQALELAKTSNPKVTRKRKECWLWRVGSWSLILQGRGDTMYYSLIRHASRAPLFVAIPVEILHGSIHHPGLLFVIFCVLFVKLCSLIN